MKRCSHYVVWGIVDGYKHGKPRNNCRCTGQAYFAAGGKKVVGVLKKEWVLIPLATTWDMHRKQC